MTKSFQTKFFQPSSWADHHKEITFTFNWIELLLYGQFANCLHETCFARNKFHLFLTKMLEEIKISQNSYSENGYSKI